MRAKELHLEENEIKEVTNDLRLRYKSISALKEKNCIEDS